MQCACAPRVIRADRATCWCKQLALRASPAANERTFLHWMSTSVTIGGIAAALSGGQEQHSCMDHWPAARVHMGLQCAPALRASHPQAGREVILCSLNLLCAGVAGHAHRHWGDDFIERAVITRIISLTMLGIAIVMAMWAGSCARASCVCCRIDVSVCAALT
jgi:uncharacterized membrane protein YidH (DUF202 family)